MAIREINLVDPGLLFSRHVQRHLILWAGCLMVALALISGFYVLKSRTVSAQMRGRGSLEQMHATLENRIEDINRLQGQLQNLHRQQGALGAVTKKQPFHWILVKLADVMNADNRITKLALDSEKGAGSGIPLKLTGFSRSNEHLGSFINRLSRGPMFTDVVLQFTRESKSGQSNQNNGMQQVQFQINCTIVDS